MRTAALLRLVGIIQKRLQDCDTSRPPPGRHYLGPVAQPHGRHLDVYPKLEARDYQHALPVRRAAPVAPDETEPRHAEQHVLSELAARLHVQLDLEGHLLSKEFRLAARGLLVPVHHPLGPAGGAGDRRHERQRQLPAHVAGHLPLCDCVYWLLHGAVAHGVGGVMLRAHGFNVEVWQQVTIILAGCEMNLPNEILKNSAL